MKPPVSPKFWYMKHIRECPLCGLYEESRERMHTPKPAHWDNRRTFNVIRYHCNY
jgi:hypothetical protein